jgi:hypothetical protein
MFKLASKSEVNKYFDDIVKEKVSQRARESDGFLTVYLGNRDLNQNYPGKNHSYLVERDNYLKRTLPAYEKNKTNRRFLSLVAWAFIPK